MSSFTCITCHVAFNDPDVQRSHYKTDWHRYNLKRKVAELPPVSPEEFQRRLILQRNSEEQQNQNTSEYCQACRKAFGNKNAFENHKNSKKHQLNESYFNSVNDLIKSSKNLENSDNLKAPDTCNEESDVEEVDSDEWGEDTENPIDNNNCLFCSHRSYTNNTLLKCIKHMSQEHSFFIPDAEYCINVRGLLTYLGEKIMKSYMCLWCNEKGKTFHSAQAAQQHMIDKGHCKMLFEGVALAEYTAFYDYSPSYPDCDEDVDVDEEVDIPEIDGTDYQLVLPSGIVVGHRSLMRYYRQSVNPDRPRGVNANTKKLHKVLAHYRALGWTSTQQEEAARKARDLHYIKRMEAKWRTKLGTKANKLQKHFRAQVNF